jgi:hypothetical protein
MHAIHNTRVQLLATALNNLGVGAILAGVIVPSINGTVGNAAHIVTWVVLGADLMALAHIILGRLRWASRRIGWSYRWSGSASPCRCGCGCGCGYG